MKMFYNNEEINIVAGDYVMFKDLTRAKRLALSLLHSVNIFQVESFEGNMVKLRCVDKLVPQNELAPIPVDGVHDARIYFDPIIAASYVPCGAEIPVHKTDYTYYMDRIKEDENLLKRISGCNYVHQIQHEFRKYSTYANSLKVDVLDY